VARLRRKRSEKDTAAAGARIPAGAASRLDWHNRRAELLNALEAALADAPDDAARIRLLKRLERAVGP